MIKVTIFWNNIEQNKHILNNYLRYTLQYMNIAIWIAINITMKTIHYNTEHYWTIWSTIIHICLCYNINSNILKCCSVLSVYKISEIYFSQKFWHCSILLLLLFMCYIAIGISMAWYAEMQSLWRWLPGLSWMAPMASQVLHLKDHTGKQDQTREPCA